MKRTPLQNKGKGLSYTGTGLKKGKKLSARPRTDEQKEIARMTREADRRFCKELWDYRGSRSEVSGAWLGSEPNWAYVHHIYPKSKYPIYRYDPDNCILMTIDEHAQVEQDGNYYPEVNKRREQLKQKYNL